MKEGRRVTNSRARRITSRVHRTINPGRKTISPVHRTRILIVPSNRPTAGNGKVARQVPNSPKTGYTHVYGGPGVSACTVLQV